MDREVVDIQEDALRSPEPILEFKEESSCSGRPFPVQVEVEEKRAAGRLTHLKEHRRPLDPPGPIGGDVHSPAASRQAR
ncbi:MAG: hypothetical protein O3C40_29365 [Planctomycetota bacterium]|nr:hypothetical protein [Planctomycetota bacterium]